MPKAYAIELTLSSGFWNALNEIERGMKMLPFYKTIERKLTSGNTSVIGKNFEHGGRPKWPKTKDLSVPPGVKVSALGRKTLILSGKLRASMTKGARNNKTTINEKGVYIDSTLPYAHIHNEGGRIPARDIKPVRKQALHWKKGGKSFFSKGHRVPGFRMKKREFATIPDQDWKDLEKAGTVFVMTKFKSPGGQMRISA